MEQLVNELSFSGCYADRPDAQTGISDFIKLSRELAKIGFKKNLKIPAAIGDRSLTAGYTVLEWSLDKEVDYDLRVYFLANATKAPYVEDLFDTEETGRELVCECFFQGNKALGLGLAFLWESPVLSLVGDSRFTDPITIKISLLEDKKELVNLDPEICSLMGSGDVNLKLAFLRGRLQRTVQDGNNLWTEKERLFPHLVFCDRAKQQITSLAGTEQHFPEVVRHLFAIEDAVSGWLAGPLKLSGVSYSTESEQTLKNQKCRAAHQILCPDATTRLFAMHTKLWSANQRIHYFPDLENKSVFIGHVGEHLKTIKFG